VRLTIHRAISTVSVTAQDEARWRTALDRLGIEGVRARLSGTTSFEGDEMVAVDDVPPWRRETRHYLIIVTVTSIRTHCLLTWSNRPPAPALRAGPRRCRPRSGSTTPLWGRGGRGVGPLDATLPDVAKLLIAMVQARDAVESRSWSHPQESMLDLRFLLIANHTVPASRYADPR
jgi:hypothetical protein